MNAANFDSAGLSTGRDITELYTTVDYLLIMSIIGAFKNYLPILAIYALLPKIEKRNEQIITKAYRIGANIIRNDMADSYSAGIAETDRQVKAMKNAPTLAVIPRNTAIVAENKRQTTEALAALQAASLVALNSARKAFLNIAGAVSLQQPKDEAEFKQIVDNAAMDYIKRGNTGKTSVDGKELSLAGYAAAVVREASFQSYLLAGAERREAYGINLVVITTHASSCPLCRPFEGKVLNDDRYSLRGYNPRYGSLNNAIRKGFGHFNCRHGVLAYKEGEPLPIVPENNPKTARLKALTYEIEQTQRRLQRDIRIAKKVKEVALTDNERLKATNTIREKQAQLRGLEAYAKKEGVPFYRQNWREQSYFEFETFKPVFADLRQAA